MTKAQWNALRYPVQLQELSEEEGGGWMAWIPMLGRGLFMVDADSPQEALQILEALRREKYDAVMKSGVHIPLPDDVTDEPKVSGKWLQRASRRLHAELRAAAERDGVSFNTYCENAMLRGHTIQAAEQALNNLAEGICEDFKLRVAVEARNARYELSKVSIQAVPEQAEKYEMIELEGWSGKKVA